ncbi:MAG: GGDEF domain-containing protein [Magnetovibrionaceae bacterium]
MVEINKTPPVLPLLQTGPDSGGGGLAGYARLAQPLGKGRPRPKKRETVKDIALIMGISVEELTPAVAGALADILFEFDTQKLELEQARRELEALTLEADQHGFLPVTPRRAFLLTMADMFRNARRSGNTIALLTLHLAGLEDLRRAQGRLAMEQALIKAATAMREEIREQGVLGSLGGSDFAALMPLTDNNQAAWFIDRLRATVSPLYLDWGLHQTDGAMTPDEALKAADRNMVERGGIE